MLLKRPANLISVCLLIAAALTLRGTVAEQAPSGLTFEQDIRPIFRAHCYDCHGATDEMEGQLDLRLVHRMARGGESGPAIVRGDADASYLVQRLRDGEMPPGQGRLAAKEIATIARWIDDGAPTARPEPTTIGPGLGITPEERGFWSFQPVRRPRIPLTSPTARVRTPIDAVLAAGTRQGGFAADASRTTLIKRAYFALTGLPPTPGDVGRWTTDQTTNWFDRLVDELLASPNYGEHWARHWLDVAGYADSEGYTDADTIRNWAWPYRDWVIRALNSDKPFDEFIVEQLAGDELAGPVGGDLSQRQIELLAATGFLRMAADGTGSGRNEPQDRHQVVADTIQIVSTALLGLSVHCSQCHDHRYDPIPQSDYYSLRAIFEPALDWRAWKTPQQRLVSLYTAPEREQAAAVEAEAQRVFAEMKAQESAYLAEALGTELDKYAEPLRRQLRTAFETPRDKRTAEQQALLFEHPKLGNLTTGTLYLYIAKWRKEKDDWYQRLADVRAQKPPEGFLRVLTEPAGHTPETRVFHRGDHQQPKQVVLPAALSVTSPNGKARAFPSNDASLPSTGRRLALAKWLTSGNHPLVARVIVNRVWMHHFGQGIVKTPADFGKFGARPTHPELLDWLADEFVRSGWSLKRLQRLIMTSTAWRQRSTIAAADSTPTRPAPPLQRPLLRLEAEMICDRMLAAAGQLEARLYGAPLGIKEDHAGQVVVDGEQTRRSIYVQVRRSQPVDMLHTFDAPVMQTNCERRSVSTVSTQALMMINGNFVLKHAALLAERVAREVEPSDDLGLQIDRAWQLVHCRSPETDELQLATDFLHRQLAYLNEHPDQLPPDVTVARQAMTNLCQTLLSSNEFLYID